MDLHYLREGSKTILASSRSRSPWHLLPPISLDDTGCAYTLLTNPSGGFVGGNHLSIRSTLGLETHVLFSTPSANRVYRSAGETAVQLVELTVGKQGVLEWMPELTITFKGAKLWQQIHVTVHLLSLFIIFKRIFICN